MLISTELLNPSICRYTPGQTCIQDNNINLKPTSKGRMIEFKAIICFTVWMMDVFLSLESGAWNNQQPRAENDS